MLYFTQLPGLMLEWQKEESGYVIILQTIDGGLS